MSPWLSVIMPTYNGADFVAAALASVRAEVRADVDVELIVVDDGSDDATRDIAERLLPTPSSRLIASGGRTGWVAATNLGLAHATGRWLCMLHQDDTWLPGRLHAVRRAIRLNPDAGFVVGASLFIDDAGRSLGRWRLPWRGGIPTSGELARRLYVQNWLGLPSATFRADVLATVGRLDTGLWYTADWDLWLRLVRATGTAEASGPLSGFRLHSASQTHVGSGRVGDFRAQVACVQERHRWAASGKQSVLSAGQLATATNVGLAAALHGNRVPWGDIAAAALQLRLDGWRRFARDSRIRDRAMPRMRLAARSQLRRHSR